MSIQTESTELLTELLKVSQRSFITAGHATFTIEGKSARYTYKVTASDDLDKPRVLFCNLLTGPNNVDDYTYIGLVNADTGQIKLTRKSRMTEESAPVVAFNWVARRIWAGLDIQPAKIYHVGRCGRCGRALTVPSSVESGFGPECSAKMGGE